ncbi:MED14-domain-containing protein [Amniculicola lignicola CBS 123094]|uniref:Mediator of RNA polymerase II transcription subunit 14 n=1 Tax=Amniculicola lignicola CBS 123094 TaxID=1392246 RepID=A0A6A5WLQ3_9PLEO|nr:MED14-domain-containing protein [Amniculicola lignicola CBS 123094]
MPGLIVMDHSGANGATAPQEGDNRKRTHEGKMVNGSVKPATAPAVSAPKSPAVAPQVNGTSTTVAAPAAATANQDMMQQLPPEIQQISADAYHSFGKLLERTCEECYRDLLDLLGQLAKITDHQTDESAPIDHKVSQQKRLMVARFAQSHRAKFIKLLVILEWGKTSSVEVAKLVDLFGWMRTQAEHMEYLDFAMTELKIKINGLRQYNPDIRTALEVLSTAKAPWIPDYGYTPPEPMTPERTLRTLRYLNCSATIRLTVHEKLPRHLKKWRVKSGRATFVVDSEFEFDVMTFTEDASEQWHFIDLRLLFSPTPEIDVDSQFIRVLKFTVDNCLKNGGLNEAFDYLHNWALTLKILFLRQQAMKLTQATWAETLKVAPVHRELVLQYWMDRPGKKNWIQIGISSNNPRDGKVSWRGPKLPSLTVRWFRHGMEVKNANAILKFDWKNLSAERMLKHVIALHTAHILRAAREDLRSKMNIKTTFSETEPRECKLEASLGPSSNVASVSVDTYSGRLIVQLRGPLAARAEHIINQAAEPQTAMTGALTHLLTSSLLDTVQRHALQLGWRQVARFAMSLKAVKEAIKQDVMHYAIFAPSGWTHKWALACIIDPTGENWYICALSADDKSIEYAERLHSDTQGHAPPKPSISRGTLSSIARVALQLVSFRATTHELEGRKVKATLKDEVTIPSPNRQAVPATLRGWMLQLNTTDLLPLKTKPGEEDWLGPVLKIVCQGLKPGRAIRPADRGIWYIVCGTMAATVGQDMKKLMATSPQKDIAFQEDGNFCILLSAPFGVHIVDHLTSRLRDLDRLRSFATTLQKRKLLLRSSSLGKVQFQYGQNSMATVDFSDENNIKLDFNPNNPHNFLRVEMTAVVNKRVLPPYLPVSMQDKDPGTGLDRLCLSLMFTRPIARIFTIIENATPGNVTNPAVQRRDTGKYRISYSNPLCSFDIRARMKDDKAFWHIEDNDRKVPDLRPKAEASPTHKRLETLKVAMDELWRSKGEAWTGYRLGALADMNGIVEMLKKLDEVVLSCKVDVEAGELVAQKISVSVSSQTTHVNTNNTNMNPRTVSQQQQQQQHQLLLQQQQQQQQLQQQQQHQQQVQQQMMQRGNVGRMMQGMKREVIELD